MKTWLLSVAATVLLTILLELMLSEGKVKKYIQGIIRLLLIFVMLLPIVKLVKRENSFNLQEISISSKDYEINDSSYALSRKRYDYIEGRIKSDILDFREADVSVLIYDIEGKLDFIQIEISGINETEDNILLREKIVTTVKKYIDISEERILINGVH